MRRVERERPRLDVADREVALGTGQALREEPLLALPVGVGDEREALAQPQRRLDRVGEPRALALRLGPATHDEAVNDDLEAVLFHLVERDVLGEVADGSVHAHAREAATPRCREELLVLALPVAHERSEHEDARVLRQLGDAVDDLLDGLRDDRDTVYRAVRNADAREEEPQVVVDLGDRSDGRSRVPRGALLVDRHRWREALDEVDVGLLHLSEKLPRVGGERLDVAALTLGVNRVEGERRLPGSGEPRDHHELVARDLHVDVLEVVLSRALDVDVVERHYRRSSNGGTIAAPAERLDGPGPMGAPTRLGSAGGA